MIEIPRHRITVRTSRSSGPGGQNVNKVETKVEVRFVVVEADWIPERARARLKTLYPNRVTREGEFVVSSDQFRSQGRNLDDCLDKLREFIEAASREPKVRRKTKPTRGSKERRLTQKKRRSESKKSRGGNGFD